MLLLIEIAQNFVIERGDFRERACVEQAFAGHPLQKISGSPWLPELHWSDTCSIGRLIHVHYIFLHASLA